MIISKCPVRISLAGGSTDLDFFLQKYGRGTVISFSANIYSYITLNTDRMGLNGLEKKYVIDYMKREVTDSIEDIKNDVARIALKHFNLTPTTVWFTSDIYASGSGLASSTSYLIALINAIQFSLNLNLTKRQICQLAHNLEKQFNPLTGFQDPYSCGTGGFNRFDFKNTGIVNIENLDTNIFDNFDTYLIHTGHARSSTDVLKTIDPDKCVKLLETAESMYSCIMNNDALGVLSLIRDGWKIKKETGKIAEDKRVVDLDDLLENDNNILAHRLLGAGNGGYFLAFTKKDCQINRLQDKLSQCLVKVNVCHSGPTCTQVR